MKLQHLAIIFVIIILPISLIVGEYIHSQINTINLQTSYSSKLQTATYDAMQSLKLNTINSKYSTVSDSKLRDIEASISTFYKSLGQEIKLNSYTREALTEYTPAILYTMYDGYYIYSKYYNEASGKYEYGLKPYIYYSCRYKKGNIDIIVNYTLDNYITIYGYVGENYITKSGNVIDPNKVTDFKYSSGQLISLKYSGVTIEKEQLSEQIVYLDANNQPVKSQYYYIIYNNNKVYYESAGKFFTINSSNKKQYINDQVTIQNLNKHVQNGKFYSDSALKYYDEAYKFSKWLKQYLPGITQEHAVDGNGNKITTNEFGISTGSNSIFDCSGFNQYNDTEITDSTFDLNRIAVIRKSIKDNLLTAIANYNNLSSNTSYEYILPMLNEEDWYKIANNISMVSFMQGIPIGTKYFNNYSIITNNENKEVVKLSTLLAITTDGEVHLLNCKDIIDGKKQVEKVYKNIDFEKQSVVITEANERYYYPHSNTKCYSCLVNAAETYDIDYIDGIVKEYDYKTGAYKVKTNADSTTLYTLRKEVLTALARERYDLYKINEYFKGYDETIGLDSIPNKDNNDFNGNIRLIDCTWNENKHLATVRFKKADGVSNTLKLQYQINATEQSLSDNTAWRTDGTYNNENNISIGEYPLNTKVYIRLFDGTYDGDYSVYTIKDIVEPEATIIDIVEGDKGDGNYYISNTIKVRITAGADRQSGVKKLEYSLTGANTTNGRIQIPSGQIIEIINDGNTIVEAWTTDNAGNYSYAILNLNKDATPPSAPTITVVEGTQGENNYYVSNTVVVRLNYGADNGSSQIDGLYYRITRPNGTVQVAKAPGNGYQITITDEGETKVDAWMKDKAGNQSVTVSKKINKDNSKPILASNLWASDITTKSFKLNVLVKDEVSGIDKIVWYYKKSNESNYKNITTTCSGEKVQVEKSADINNLTSGIYNTYARIYDKAGNIIQTGILNVTTLNVEKIGLATVNPTSWTNGNVTVTLPTKSGLTTQYQIGSRINLNGSWTTYTGPITITNNTTVYYRYTDGTNQGDYNSITILNIDKIAPGATTIAYNSGSNSTSWQNNINIRLSATDTGGSGIQCYEIDTNGDGHPDYNTIGQPGGISNFVPPNGFNSDNVRFRAVDNAQNKGAWTSKICIRMDNNNPTLNASLSAVGEAGKLTLSLTVTDEVSGLGKVVWYYKLSSASNWNTQETAATGTKTIEDKTITINNLPAGTYQAYAVVYDMAGNSVTTQTVTANVLVIFNSQEFNYTGNIQEFTVPVTGYYKLEVWGAQGGASLVNGSVNTFSTGLGGYSSGIGYYEAGTVLYVVVGGKGANGTYRSDAAGGYNGGGLGTWDNSDDEASGGGGGATHIAKATGVLSNLSSQRDKVLIVAGGGGGGSFNYAPGNGGGYEGGANSTGLKATQTIGNAFGKGQDATGTGDSDGVGGGGGGYYGGYTRNENGKSAGGGGSGYVGAMTYDGYTQSGVQSGNGKAKITYKSDYDPNSTTSFYALVDGNLVSGNYISATRWHGGYSDGDLDYGGSGHTRSEEESWGAEITLLTRGCSKVVIEYYTNCWGSPPTPKLNVTDQRGNLIYNGYVETQTGDAGKTKQMSISGSSSITIRLEANSSTSNNAWINVALKSIYLE